MMAEGFWRGTLAGDLASRLQVGVTCAQHGGETRGFFLAAPAFTRFFEVPMVTHLFERAFAVDFLFQPAQRPIHRFTFFQPDLGQLNSLPLRGQRRSGQTAMASPASRQGRDDRKARRGVSMGKKVPLPLGVKGPAGSLKNRPIRAGAKVAPSKRSRSPSLWHSAAFLFGQGIPLG